MLTFYAASEVQITEINNIVIKLFTFIEKNSQRY